MILTKNEHKIINLLLRHTYENFTIREISRKINITPMGARKILNKFKKENILISKKIGTGIFYKLNFNNRITQKICELVLAQNKLNLFAQVYAEDLKILENCTESCILFGSILVRGEKARDVDVMLLIEKEQYKNVEKISQELSEKKAKKIHFMMQTKEDFIKNLTQKNKAVLNIIKNGVVLWGENHIVEAIKNVVKKEI